MKTTRYITIIAGALILLASCSANRSNAPQEAEAEEEHHHTEEVELTQTQLKTVGITLGSVARKKLGSVVRASGELRLNPQDKADVTSLMGGIVRRITVTEGQRVSAGQPVAYIENTDIVEMQKNYLIAAREKQSAQQELQRQHTLSSQGAGVEKTLQQAEAASATAQARLTGLAHQLLQVGVSPQQALKGRIVTQIPVRAAIAGTVGKVSVSTGTYVDTATPLMQIANNAAVYASLNVFERDIPHVAEGQSVDFVITNTPAAHIKGRVSRINRTIDPVTKAVPVHAAIAGGGGASLMEGMYVTALIYTGEREVDALPDDAIVSLEGRKYVFLLDSRKKEGEETAFHFKKAEVVTGVTELGYTQVDFVKPLPPGATVVTSGAFYLASMAADHGEH